VKKIFSENILLQGDVVKLADLGSCRGMFSEHPYTEYISTRWYRPPECLMTDGYYDHKVIEKFFFKGKKLLDGYLGSRMCDV